MRQVQVETPFPGIVCSDYTDLYMLYETLTVISATDGTSALNRNVTVGNRDPNDPNGPLIPLLDRQGQGNGTTPFTRYYSPVVEVDPYDQQLAVFDIDADPNTETVTSLWTRWDDSTLALDGKRSGNMVMYRFKAGEFTITSSGPPCLDTGDANCDGFVNNGDIDPFVLALSGDPATWSAWPRFDVRLLVRE